MHPSIHARQTPERLATVMAETGEVRSYAQLERRSNQVAHLLRAQGLKRGDVVAVVLKNRIEYFDIAWGAQRAGLYFVCISTRLVADEIRYILDDCNARFLFVDGEFSSLVDEIAAEISCLVVGSQEDGAFEATIARFPDTPIADESAGSDMLYSSGTTGRPKGVKPPLPDGPLAAAMPMTEMGERLWGLDNDTVFLSPAPLYHAAPLRWCMVVQRLGGTVIVMERFDPEAALALIERHRVTHAQWVPTHFVRMLKLPEDVRMRYDHTSLRAVWHAAAPCPLPIKEAMLAWWGPVIYEYYSGTEANGLTHIGPQEWLAHRGSVGRAIWGIFHVCDEDGNDLPPGQEGQIWVADGLSFTYHNDPEKTAQAHNNKGWSSLGDVGWMDDEGYLYLTDRKNFMIISGGVNIYPQEIENCLITHPGIHEAAVFGVPDEDLGERVIAVIEPIRWEDAGEPFVAELREWLDGRIARIKTPRNVFFEQSLPRQPTGKMNKRELQHRYAEGVPMRDQQRKLP